ncbi:MAG: BamA/TamA family outer membrane protein [Hyphomicrobiales bacterium]|nr:BamA/TamA family outer membrane protein [Hyphomicrobiales bacterium]MBV9908509.1 BamA/TamA family outer membrane protein [Hyphomicrobiales bacterium]
MRLVVALVAGVIVIGDWTVARAFDFFGLFGSDDTPPAVSQAAIPYSLTVQVNGDDSGLKNAVRDASSLYRLRKDAPADGEALARRAQSDFAPVIDALWGAGYYNAAVTISIDGASLAIGSSDIAAFARAAETYRNRVAAPVVIKVEPGPLFKLRSVRILNALGVEFSEAELPPRIVGLKPGDPAAAADIRAAQARIIDYFRKQGRPLAKIQSVVPVVDHAQDIMDLTVTAAPGPVAPFGEATINGPQTFDPAIVRSFLYIQPGDPYSPAAIADARNSIRQIPAVGGVRITEGTTLDAYGRLPYQIDVEDRLPYSVGASLKYSTTNGPEGQVYWEDRNVFGGAERLRLQASVFYAPPWYIASQSLSHFSSNDIGGRVSASFLKPALWGTTNDLLIDALAEKMSTSGAGFVGYQAEDVDVTGSLRHRFNQNFWVQAGLEAQKGDATDALGTVNYQLIGVPVSANFDTTDSKLDPTRGVRLNASAVGFGTFLGSTLDMVQVRAGASAYYSIDADSRYVLAGRVAAGGMAGPELDQIPANWRFYTGGGGSVRGYAYNELGPTVWWGAVVGGKSVFDASAELRVKVTDNIGVVPFFDIGNAFTSNVPNFSEPLFAAAGLGLRYYTSVGPIRLDVAFPFERRAGNGPVAVYVSIGQSF